MVTRLDASSISSETRFHPCVIQIIRLSVALDNCHIIPKNETQSVGLSIVAYLHDKTPIFAILLVRYAVTLQRFSVDVNEDPD